METVIRFIGKKKINLLLNGFAPLWCEVSSGFLFHNRNGLRTNTIIQRRYKTMAMIPMEYKEIKSESFSASMTSGAALLYSGADRVVVAVETTDVPFVVGIEKSGNNWYVNCAKLSTGTPRYYITPDNATITGKYYYLDA